MNHQLNIIGGKFRGKKLQFPESEDLRPTPNRIRETLFNWLMNNIQDKYCLDAFAGSGALGLEAFSRGAKEVLFIEQITPVYIQLQKNISTFNSQNLKAIKMNCLDFLEKTQEQFDIIFLDPPFAKNFLCQCFELIFKNKLLASDGFVYFETGQELFLEASTWTILHSKKAGSVHYGLVQLREG